MIAIENKLISDEVIEEHFVCDLNKCKGGCCEDGDAGAPLEKAELTYIKKYFDVIKPYLTAEGLAEIEKQGRYIYDEAFGWVTPTINGGICAYGKKDESGIIKCGIEQAYLDGKTDWKKPSSCHLYPIKISRSSFDPDLEYLNYEPRPSLCRPGCMLGKELRVPVYKFLKEALVNKYGEDFYSAIEEYVKQYNK